MSNITISTMKSDGLVTDAPFQRPLDDARVKRMAVAWNDAMFGVPEVAMLNGEAIVVDGQHRVEAGKLAGKKNMKVRVHRGLTYTEVVDLYRRINKERKKLELVDDFTAALEQQDPDALALNQRVQAAGYVVGRGGGRMRIQAVGELWAMYRLDESLITDALSLCRAMDAEESLTAEMIGGVHQVLHYVPGIDRKRLTKVLCKHTPRWWSANADVATNSSRRSARMAVLICREYNKGLRVSRVELANI